MTAPARLEPAQLRELFLFTDLQPAQLDWVAQTGDVVTFPAGSDVSTEGEPAECFYVLLSGTLRMSRRVGRDEVETVRTDQPGVFSGAVQFYLGDQVTQVYPATVRAVTDCTFLALPAAATHASWASSRSANRNSSRSSSGVSRACAVSAVTGPPGSGARG